MEERPDTLLRATRLVLMLTMAVAALVGLAMLLAIPFVWVFSSKVVVAAAENGFRLSGNDASLAISSLLGAGLLLVGLAFLFLRKLVAIIDSVGQGSPFVPENAARLRAMGWIALAFQLLSLLAAPAELWLARVVPGSHVQVSFSFSGLIVALLLFVLARVFDHGTRLAEDVEGTV